MSKLFISYAHSSPQHKYTVSELVKRLRSHGHMVDVDADVKTPQGPEEGWPRWMKRQIEEADWVLIMFDEHYRRRFDGGESLGTGLGATWEGLIITQHFYRACTRNTKFIPLLSDGADSILIPDELFGFTRYSIPSQTDELANAILVADGPGALEPTIAAAGIKQEHARLQAKQLIASGRVPFLELDPQFTSHPRGCIDFALSIRNLGDGIAVSPSIQLDKDNSQRKFKSLAKQERATLALNWANDFGSNLVLKVVVHYSVIEGHKFRDEGVLHFKYFANGQPAKVPSIEYAVNQRHCLVERGP